VFLNLVTGSVAHHARLGAYSKPVYDG